MLSHTPLLSPTHPARLNPERAFLTDDDATVLRFAAEALAASMAAVLVTLVEIRGGAARPLGAQMAVREDGFYCGFVSGGCVEAAVAYEAMEVMATGQDREVVYGDGSPYFDIVLTCGGGITLSLHKLETAQPLLAVLNNLERRKPGGLRYTPRSQTLQSISPTRSTGWNQATFEIYYRPCPRVLVYGRSVEAQATATIAQAAGYDVHMSDGFQPRAGALMDADTAVVLLCHDLHRELPVLHAALAANPFYIGALGSQRTHGKRMLRLRELGWRSADIARIKAPIGLFPKARDAHSLALSILAEVAAVRLGGISDEAAT
ncbi:hypothetical protein Sant_3135 [Sodalis praecaptivus]|uniref:Xanthine dehydrogenase accessory factor n=1 Tax=Sodalis praecaptivus TaxID=1239307 RepID=W0HWI4_9GAMM|nr:XdhC family protein [Sodalis praecaptivus]AHF78139.1 hypothetical protein Sant_3135 [Sodalis praecaptivus]